MLLHLFILTVYFLPTFAKRGGYGGSSVRVSYPSSKGLSGTNIYQRSHSYPQSTGLSGNSHPNVPRYHQKTEIHHHYNSYAPPQYISYGPTHHPVYHGAPPVYVYEYRNSGSRFDNLLTGLALYNLGRMSSSHDRYREYGDYRSRPGEYCKLVISKQNGEYEETRIDCKLMSSFIWDSEREASTNTVSKTVNITQTILKDGNSTVTVQNTAVVDALQVKGPSIHVTQGMDCFMIRVFGDYSKLRKRVDCALLQEYARSSLRYSSSVQIKFRIVWLVLSLLVCFK